MVTPWAMLARLFRSELWLNLWLWYGEADLPVSEVGFWTLNRALVRVCFFVVETLARSP